MRCSEDLKTALPLLRQSLAEANRLGLSEFRTPSGRTISVMEIQDSLDAFIDQASKQATEVHILMNPIVEAIVRLVGQACYEGAYGLCSKNQTEMMANKAAQSLDLQSSSEDIQSAVELLWVD
jgi:hypothetical protein